jgi:hypothetical protein
VPQLVAVAAASVIGAGTAATVIGYGTTLVASIAFSRYNQRRAQRQQQASLQDRTTPVRQSDAARTIVYGRTRVSGPIVYHKTHGTRNEIVSHVIPIAGHEITAVDDVWFNDRSIAPWTAGPVAAGSPYFVSRAVSYAHRFTGSAPAQSLPAYGGTLVAVDTVSYTDTRTISGGEGQAYFVSEDSREVPLDVGTGYIVGGTSSAPTVTLVGTAAHGKPVTVTYRIDRGDAYASVWAFLGTAAGQRDENLEGWSGGEWTSAALGRNVARLHVRTDWQETLYATGFPGVSAIVRGKRVYDPRLDSTNGGSGTHRADTASTWAYSDNPALCAVDYLRDALGFGCASTEIDWPSVIAAANVCDELIPIDAGGGTQKRYTVAGVLSTETERKTNLEALLDAMVGIAVYSGGRWTIRAGAYVTPTLDLDEGDLAGGDITIQARANRRDLFNAVRGRYREPNQLYQVTDFPPYNSTTYAAEDAGEVIYREIDLPMVDDARRAQRIAKLILFRARQALTIQATFKLSAYALQPGDTCRLTIARYGWTTKVFRVLRREFGSLSTVRLTLQEDASAIYAWSFNEALVPDPAPNTALPDPRFVALPAGIVFTSSADTFYVKPDGAVVPYVAVSWTVPAADDVRVEVFWKRTGELEYRRIAAPIGASYVWLEGVAAGEVLNVYMEAVNGIGARSQRFWRPSYTVSDALQSADRSSSSNLLRGASLDAQFAQIPGAVVGGMVGDFAVFLKSPLPQFNIAGTPSSAYLAVLSTLTGSAAYAFREWPRVSAQPGESFAAYAELMGNLSDACVGVQWYDAAGSRIGGPVFGNTIARAASPLWDNPANYALSALIAEAPAGVRTGAFAVFARGNWQAGAEKSVTVHRPFLGRVQPGATQLPAWDAGGANVVDTQLIEPNAVSLLFVDERPTGATIVPGTSQLFTEGLPQITLPADADIPDGAPLRIEASVQVTFTQTSAIPASFDLRDLTSVLALRDSAGGGPNAIAMFDLHFTEAPDLLNRPLLGSGVIQYTTTHRRGTARTFDLQLSLSTLVNGSANITSWQVLRGAGCRMVVEAYKTSV